MENRQFSTFIGICAPDGSHAATLEADYFELELVPESDEHGTRMTVDHTFHIEKPDAGTVGYFAMARNAIVTLRYTDGGEVAIGSRLLPARAHVYEMAQGYGLRVWM